MHIKKILPVCLAAIFLTGCGIFPKEEELQRTPIIQAYEQEEFKMADVKKGTLQLYETLDVVCMNMGETRYSFGVSNLAYQGVYVTLGQKIAAGTKIADLAYSYTDTDIADISQVELKAKEDSTVTYLSEVEDGEKSVAGQLVAITNTKDAFYLNVFTEFWKRFNVGDIVPIHIAGGDYNAQVIDSSEIGIESSVSDDAIEGEVYFKIKEEGLYLKGEDVGTITILVDERKDVLYVPKSAITEVNGKEMCMLKMKTVLKVYNILKLGCMLIIKLR